MMNYHCTNCCSFYDLRGFISLSVQCVMVTRGYAKPCDSDVVMSSYRTLFTRAIVGPTRSQDIPLHRLTHESAIFSTSTSHYLDGIVQNTSTTVTVSFTVIISLSRNFRTRSIFMKSALIPRYFLPS